MPLDVIKVRMQIQGTGGLTVFATSYQAAAHLWTNEGLLAFWTGTSPAILRQATYGTLRVGLYVRAKSAFGVEENSIEPFPLRKMLAGIVSGSFAAAMCNPTDLIKVRMQSSRLPGSSIPHYQNVFHAASSIVKEGGWIGLYRGVGPTTGRAAVVAAAELGSYDEIKMFLRRRGAQEGVPLHLGTAALAGLCATAASSPFDVVKSRVMSQPVNARGEGIRYSGMIDCIQKSFRNEGIRFMWRGFFANYLNKGPTVVLFFALYEQVQYRLDLLLDG
eukprot:CAMPEP_0197526566 /NCGR_PEP_ID=MMETSP1318-20131121/18247_1 /TAXON_ID=552666 /ORGANISM="Partenskyella glossopodia, Strain RCC365" /LENGTH=274 /DNA_ID=CAMNT_0043080779 /DNA_START=5 /DNA_END=829 /DNA_ORIENTATION=-